MKKLILFLVAFGLVVPSAMAKYKGKHKDFIEGPVSHIITKKEIKDFKKLKTDSEAEEFVMLFWARRDPTPGTARNEFKEKFDFLVNKADEKFSSEYAKGSETDRGKILILFGFPNYSKASDYQGVPSEGFQSQSMGSTKSSPKSLSSGSAVSSQRDEFIHGTIELWVYKSDRLPECVQQQELMFKFLKEEKAKFYTLDRQHAETLQSIEKAIECGIKTPDLNTVPEYARKFSAGPSKLIKTLDNIVTGQAEPSTSKGFWEHNAFFSDSETLFLANSIFLPEKQWTKNFEQLDMAVLVQKDGSDVVRIEEEVPVVKTNGGYYVDRSIILPPGTYRIGFCLGQVAGDIFYSDVQTIEIPAVNSESYKGIWYTIASDVKPLDEAQYVTDPYAFGGVKVVPQSDKVFSVASDFWGFINVFNPSLDDMGRPKLSYSFDFYKDKKRLLKTGLLEATPTKLNDGRYAIGRAFNIGSELKLEPGTYTFKLMIKDQIAGESWTEEQEFTVVE